ncbi:MAG: hypothetical protein MZU95_13375 [Desulfomicrobium escambiense]|nr:hypothetical protein [Desulfomicrobium escambiense]
MLAYLFTVRPDTLAVPPESARLRRLDLGAEDSLPNTIDGTGRNHDELLPA